ncbi:ATPase component of an ABC superfamily Fe3+-siderophore transporter [Proteus hauseri ATCC 700826]|uniref:ATPase component of an ABC superfamily Fe3+-siderophore transporter n=1 Tax=Proteus hauseri ATCC 700826 TaxID=1354271 RepID=A0AAJ3HVE8_PROHU|nr:ABC transporter ATP-binding protein [Proteus hauseri]OAT50252.1 ATPase component of an ABC superfamily Fe3+-siderophore transporter [Proteus hauseri ATCC 700826]
MNNNRLQTHNLKLGYQQTTICQDISLTIPDKQVTVIIGPNGCGKSTLLRSLCRLLKPLAGYISLDNQPLTDFSTKVLARQMALLPQTMQAPAGITVANLVARGRFPHQSFMHQWSQDDKLAVDTAMRETGVTEFADKTVDSLSGGQRQRVWVAMVLAQQTDILLLDEPTTYLDIAYQIELLNIFRKLNREQARTVVAVLHDLNQACRYADNLVVMVKGQIVAQGEPQAIVNEALIKQVFDLECQIIPDPIAGTPMIIPC